MKHNLLILLITFLSIATLQQIYAESNSSKVKVKIGVISCLSGEFARIGQDAVDAMILANEEMQSKGSTLDVQFFVEDDSFSLQKAISAYNKLTSFDGIEALIGVSSTAVTAIGKDVAKKRIPMAQVFLETESYDDSIIQIAPDMDGAEFALGQKVKTLTTGKTILIVPTNDTWLRLATAFENGYGKTNFKREEIPVGDYDLKSLALRVKSQKPERVVLLLGPEQGPLILKELFQVLDSSTKFAFDANFLSGLSEYQKMIPDLSRISDAPLLILANVENSEFRSKFKKRFAREAGPWAEFSADAFNVLLSSYDKNNEAWIEKMLKYKAAGVSGQLSFASKGLRPAAYKIKTVADVLKGKNL